MKLVMFRTRSLDARSGALLPGAGDGDLVDLVAALRNRGLTPPTSTAMVIVPETREVASDLANEAAQEPEPARAAGSLHAHVWQERKENA